MFSYDMVGYNDTNQFPHGDNPTALGGPREDLWNINVMGLQLWNSVRALDFLTTLPDVDSTCLPATGASGRRQRKLFLLMATDDRIKVAAPGEHDFSDYVGNGCEEGANLRVGAFNVMFGAMMAPRPLLMVSATGDWTVNTPKEEFPAVQGIYRMLDAESNVEMVQIDQKHNYSKESREAVYTFFNSKLLGGRGPVKEQRYRVEQLQDLPRTLRQNPARQCCDDGSLHKRPYRDRQARHRSAGAKRQRLTSQGPHCFPRASDVLSAGCEARADQVIPKPKRSTSTHRDESLAGTGRLMTGSPPFG